MATVAVGTYRLTYDSQGHYHYAHDENGRMVHVKDSPEYTDANPLTAEFLEAGLDLSDRPDLAEEPDPEPIAIEEG